MQKFLVAVGALLIGTTAWAAAQDFGLQGWGIRAGVSVDPDQGYGGVHWDIGSPSSSLRIRPNIELGLGDDTTLVAANGEVDWYFRKQGDWFPYAGGAFSIQYIDVDLPPGAMGDDNDVELGFYAVGGLETLMKSSNKMLFEVKIGFGDAPDFKAGIGWTF